MRIVFMGTPDFSVPALRALVEAGHQVTAVVTQPDKPKGRGKDVQMTPVKIQALEYGIPVYQPVKVKTPEFVEVLKKEAPECHCCYRFWSDLIQRDPGSAKIWLCKHPCILTSKIPWCSTDPVGCDRRRKRDRCYDHDDGCWPGYR